MIDRHIEPLPYADSVAQMKQELMTAFSIPEEILCLSETNYAGSETRSQLIRLTSFASTRASASDADKLDRPFVS